jgi:hypothetical protein
MFDTTSWDHVRDSPSYLSPDEEMHTDGQMLLICPRSGPVLRAPSSAARVSVAEATRVSDAAQVVDWQRLCATLDAEDNEGADRIVVAVGGRSLVFWLGRVRRLADSIRDYVGPVSWDLVPTLAKTGEQTYMLVLVGDDWRAAIMPMSEPTYPVVLSRSDLAQADGKGGG